MKSPKNRLIGASAMLIAAAGATVSAVDFDLTLQGGQYDTAKAATVVRGDGGTFDNVRVFAPFLLPADNAFLNTCTVQAEPVLVRGVASLRPLGSVTTGSNILASARLVTAIGSSDLEFPAGASNAFIGEGNALNSNAAGTLLSDGTLVWREAFSASQNNMGFETIRVEPQTAIGDVGNTAANLLWDTTANGVGNGTTRNPGAIFTGTPGAARNDAGELFISNTNFDAFTGDVPRGANVWNAGVAGGVDPTIALTSWLQDDTIGDLLPDEELNSNGVRQTQSHLQRVVSPDTGNSQIMALFGVGISGGVNLGGGSAVPRYLVIDSATDGNSYAGAIFIEADSLAGGTDLMNADINVTDPAFGFIDHQATGGGGGPFVNSQFDMNTSGDVVALWEDTTGSISVYEIRLYAAQWTGDNISGYDAPIVIARSGEDGIETNVQDTVLAITTELIPMTGPAIDDEGRIAFIGLTEAIYDPAAPMGMPDLIGSTSTLFVWQPDAAPRGVTLTGSLHAIVSGGNSGDVLADADAADNAGGDLSLEIGSFPINPQGTSDAFSRASLSDEGGFIAVNFRNGLANDAAFGGGVLFDPNAPADTTDAATRGTIIVSLGDFTVVDNACPGDCDLSGTVDFSDLVAMLFEFGNAMPSDECNADGVGGVDFGDLVATLFLFGPCP